MIHHGPYAETLADDFALTPNADREPTAHPLGILVSSAKTDTGSDVWATPWHVVESACTVAGVPAPWLDIAAVADTAKAPHYFGPDHRDRKRRCGLRADVAGFTPATAWCNPPWSDVGPWLDRCAALAGLGWTALALIPLRPSTRAWRRRVWAGAAMVLCADRRVAFEINGHPGASCPHDVAVVVWTPESVSLRGSPLWRL